MISLFELLSNSVTRKGSDPSLQPVQITQTRSQLLLHRKLCILGRHPPRFRPDSLAIGVSRSLADGGALRHVILPVLALVVVAAVAYALACAHIHAGLRASGQRAVRYRAWPMHHHVSAALHAAGAECPANPRARTVLHRHVVPVMVDVISVAAALTLRARRTEAKRRVEPALVITKPTSAAAVEPTWAAHVYSLLVAGPVTR